jgi:hypothetical protein
MSTKCLSIAPVVFITLSMSLAQARSVQGNAAAAEEARRTLKELRASAVVVENEADELNLFEKNPQISPETEIVTLMALKSEINKMGREMYALDSERDSLTPWEQQAISKTLPLLKDSAENTQAAIEYCNENRNHLWTKANRTYAERLVQDSEQMEKTLRDYLKYASVHEQEQHLETSLGTAAAGN